VAVATRKNETLDDGSGDSSPKPRPQYRTIRIEEYSMKVELTLSEEKKEERMRYLLWRRLAKPFKFTSVPSNVSNASNASSRSKPERLRMEVCSARKQKNDHLLRYKEKMKQKQINAANVVTAAKVAKAANVANTTNGINGANSQVEDTRDDVPDDMSNAGTHETGTTNFISVADDGTCESGTTGYISMADDGTCESGTTGYYTDTTARDKPESPQGEEPSDEKQEGQAGEQQSPAMNVKNNKITENRPKNGIGDVFDTVLVGIDDIFLCRVLPELFDDDISRFTRT
jgi:hypothetical protein